MRIGFDNTMYISMQADRIRQRISEFGGKLYLEFGGKLLDDNHASRVLPGFEPDSKARMLQQLSEEAEVIFAISAADIESGKRRSDIGITYADDVLRLMDIFRSRDLAIGGVVITRFSGQPKAEAYQTRLENMGIHVYRHYPILGYPSNVDLIVSEDGYGKNEYVKTSHPLVVVTAPGPGSGKLAVCLSQLYNENTRGIKAGYAKFETFPVWNLPLKHPVNVAYEAATADLDDNNVIDPYHLEAHNTVTVNYNRDVEAFPVLKAIMEKIAGTSPYQSPTDMGVNMVGNCIIDDEACQNASRAEIVRRWFKTAERLERTGMGERELDKISLLMKEVGVDQNFSPAHASALIKAEVTGKQAGALVAPDGTVITGKASELLDASASVLLKALKYSAHVDKKAYIVSDEALEPICSLKSKTLREKQHALTAGEMLIALSISSISNSLAKDAIASADFLKGCDVYFSSIIPAADEEVFRKLGINVCCEPLFEQGSFYHQ